MNKDGAEDGAEEGAEEEDGAEDKVEDGAEDGAADKGEVKVQILHKQDQEEVADSLCLKKMQQANHEEQLVVMLYI